MALRYINNGVQTGGGLPISTSNVGIPAVKNAKERRAGNSEDNGVRLPVRNEVDFCPVSTLVVVVMFRYSILN